MIISWGKKKSLSDLKRHNIGAGPRAAGLTSLKYSSKEKTKQKRRQIRQH